MAPIPNHLEDVQKINLQHPQLLIENSVNSCGKFTELVVTELNRLYPEEGWGHVGKVPGQTQHEHWFPPVDGISGHAVDSGMSKLDLTKAIDFIQNGHNPPNPGKPAWQETTSGGQRWLPPNLPDGGGGGGGGVNGGNHDCNCKEEIAALQSQIDELKASSLRYDSEVGVKMAGGLVINFRFGGGSEPYKPVELETREGVGADEIVRLIKP